MSIELITRCKKTTCALAALMLLVGAAPAVATESEVRAEKQAGDEATPQAPSETPPDTRVCVEKDAEVKVDVNTLEDIFSLSGANMQAILSEADKKSESKAAAGHEVRWEAVGDETGKASPNPSGPKADEPQKD